MTAKPPETLTLERLETPLGEALIVTDEHGLLRAFNWRDYEDALSRWLGKHYPRAVRAEGKGPHGHAFQAYFAGDRDALTGVAWAASGTAFQQEVWAALCEIPAGETWSYARLAARIGRPKAVRAVGRANGANPVALVAPCHRVIGADGSLTGYGGSLPRKQWLLAHEGVPGAGRRAA